MVAQSTQRHLSESVLHRFFRRRRPCVAATRACTSALGDSLGVLWELPGAPESSLEGLSSADRQPVTPALVFVFLHIECVGKFSRWFMGKLINSMM